MRIVQVLQAFSEVGQVAPVDLVIDEVSHGDVLAADLSGVLDVRLHQVVSPAADAHGNDQREEPSITGPEIHRCADLELVVQLADGLGCPVQAGLVDALLQVRSM